MIMTLLKTFSKCHCAFQLDFQHHVAKKLSKVELAKHSLVSLASSNLYLSLKCFQRLRLKNLNNPRTRWRIGNKDLFCIHCILTAKQVDSNAHRSQHLFQRSVSSTTAKRCSNLPCGHSSPTLLSLQRSSPTLLYNTCLQHCSTTLLYNTSLQDFSTTLLSKTSIPLSSPTLCSNTSRQYFSTTLFSFSTTLPYNSLLQLTKNSQNAAPAMTLRFVKRPPSPRHQMLHLPQENDPLALTRFQVLRVPRKTQTPSQRMS